ncbi:MAG: hypothetical protein IJ026_06620 [Candidatus Methanomethylophilaceae archaeon]|nr:hypothetical protein [Candidatus Methanomethylophilaceae archaeon]
MTSPLPVTESIAQSFDIPVYEVSLAFGEDECPIIIGDNTLEELVSFSKSVGAKTVMVQYDYVDPEDLVVNIEEETLQALFGEDADSARVKIRDHNRDIIVEDWDAPYAMNVFVMHEGHPFGVRLYNEVYADAPLIDPEEFVMDMLENPDIDDESE